MKIGLMFLTYTNPIHKDAFFEKEYIGNDDCKIIIHPKFADKVNDYWKQFIAKTVIPTEWGTESIAYATVSLIKECLDDGCDWFCLCSEDSYPLVSFNELYNKLSSETLSMFSPSENKFKTSQWFIINRTDAENIVNTVETDDESVDTLINKIKRMNDGAIDEYFFLMLLKSLDNDYKYTPYNVHYVEWFPNVISKHPIIFNRLLRKNKDLIDEYESFFIRKTLPTFKPDIFKPKKNAVAITIGTESLKKNINYDEFLDKIKNNYDLYIFFLKDNIEEIDVNLKTNCVQIFPVVWKFVKEGYKNLNTYFGETYNNIIIIEENEEPTHYLLESISLNQQQNQNRQNQQQQSRPFNQDDENGTEDIDVNDTLLDYYKLKEKYDTTYRNKVMSKVAGKKSKIAKRAIFRTIGKPQCINCKQPVGTIFKRKYYQEYEGKNNVIVFTAKCGDPLNPCELNIEICKSARYPYNSLIKNAKSQLNNSQLEIIKLKNEMLFLGKNKNEEYINKFMSLKEDIKYISEELGTYYEENVILNDNPEDEEQIEKMTYSLNQNEILNFKEYIKSYVNNDDKNALQSAINIYLDDIQPKIKKINEMKYKYSTVEKDENTGIKTLVQLKNSYDTSYFYDESVDKVNNFIKGTSLKTSKKKLKSKLIENEEIEELKETKETKRKSSTLKSRLSNKLNKTKKKRLVLDEQEDEQEEPEPEQPESKASQQILDELEELEREIIPRSKKSSKRSKKTSFKIIEDSDEEKEEGEGEETSFKMSEQEPLQITKFGKKIVLNEATEAK